MSILKSHLRRLINSADRCFGLRRLMREEGTSACQLLGDRAIEWSWVVAHLPNKPGRVLDLGCVGSVLTGIAARMGHDVIAVDLNDIEYEMPNVIFRRGDINEMDFGGTQFAIIMNCSMIEHIGLGGRYGSREMADGDLKAMRKLSTLLTPDGRMILTIPVGIDGEFAPFHRVYGENRLPLLLSSYTLVKEEYWHKAQPGKWKICDRRTALATEGSSAFYALGLFLLGRADR